MTKVLAALLRDDLAHAGAVRERRCSAVCAFMVDGHMVCGVHKGGGMFRVGKDRQRRRWRSQAPARWRWAGGTMGGMVDVGPTALADDGPACRLLALALETVRSPAAEVAKPPRIRL